MLKGDSFDVVVAGAGPAGAVAALSLARAGVRVGLLDKARFARPKVCGGVLGPGAQQTLDELGLWASIERTCHRVQRVDVSVNARRPASWQGPFWAARRAIFDDILVQAAVGAGARLLESVAVHSPLLTGDDVVQGVRCQRTDGDKGRFEIRATVTILATGACSKTLRRFGVCARTTPSALAMRAHWRAPQADPDRILMAFEDDRAATWAIPLGDDLFNVGAALVVGDDGRVVGDLNRLLERTMERGRVLGDALRGGRPVDRAVGAPMRMALEGARPWKAGLLVAGEALGTTHPLTGQGLWASMESGRLAAMATLGALGTGQGQSLDAYVKLLRRDGWDRPQRWDGSVLGQAGAALRLANGPLRAFPALSRWVMGRFL